MALIPATIEVTFTSQYTGNHRICWRLATDPPLVYNCTLEVFCAAGNTCVAIIATFVDNETCDNLDFSGYVQPVCVAEGSPLAQTPFANTFIPAPACTHYIRTCLSAGVEAITFLSSGAGYSGNFPVTFVGDGFGATGTAIVIAGLVNNVTIDTPGTGYTAAVADFSAGDGAGASGTVELLPCSAPVQGCDDDTSTVVDFEVGESYGICATGPVSAIIGQSLVPDGGCICEACYTVEVSNPTGLNLNAYYVSCITQILTSQLIGPGASGVQLGGGTCLVIGDTVVVDPGITIDSSVIC